MHHYESSTVNIEQANILLDCPCHWRLRDNADHIILFAHGMARRHDDERLHREFLFYRRHRHGDICTMGDCEGELVRLHSPECFWWVDPPVYRKHGNPIREMILN